MGSARRRRASTSSRPDRATVAAARSPWPFEDHLPRAAYPHRGRRARHPDLRRPPRGSRPRRHRGRARQAAVARAGRRNVRGAGPDVDALASAHACAGCPHVDPARLPRADALVATAWQCRPMPLPRRPRAAGARFYLVQHYESLYHGEPQRVDATLRAAAEKDRDLDVARRHHDGALRQRRRTVLVTPVDRDLFHPVPEARSDDGAARPHAPPRLRVEGRAARGWRRSPRSG